MGQTVPYRLHPLPNVFRTLGTCFPKFGRRILHKSSFYRFNIMQVCFFNLSMCYSSVKKHVPQLHLNPLNKCMTIIVEYFENSVIRENAYNPSIGIRPLSISTFLCEISHFIYIYVFLGLRKFFLASQGLREKKCLRTAVLKNSERSDECIDFTMIITSRNNAPISNFRDGFRWKSEYPWCIIEFKSKQFLKKNREKQKKKNDGKTGIFTQNQFSTKLIMVTTEIFNFSENFLKSHSYSVFRPLKHKPPYHQPLEFFGIIYMNIIEKQPFLLKLQPSEGT
ncbi:Uncharacterized protein FWK35_00011098, partial [Aphis craccivora]